MTRYALAPDLQELPPLRLAGPGLFQSFFERSGICMAALDPVLRVREANEEFCRQVGHTAVDCVGASIFGFIHRSSHERLSRQIARVTDGRRSRVTGRVLGLGSNAAAFSADLTVIGLEDVTGSGSSLVLMVKPEVAPGEQPVAVAGKKVLSELDARIVEGIAAGISTVQLASRLYLSRQGIEYRVGMMLRKMHVPNRAALVSRAYSMGVLSVGVWPPHVLREFVG
jgi:DNA-binding NarL/FixJ family response regulator